MVALIAARHLKCAARCRELADVDVLDVRAIHAQGNGILGLAGGGAGVTADADGLVDVLSPLDRIGHGGKVSWAPDSAAVRADGRGDLSGRRISRVAPRFGRRPD